jgi:hypothetical protein
MAIARCEKCGRPRANKPPDYVQQHLPISYPNSGVICGTKGCENPATVWLKADEEHQYQIGVRIFDIRTNSAKVMVQGPATQD